MLFMVYLKCLNEFKIPISCKVHITVQLIGMSQEGVYTRKL